MPTPTVPELPAYSSPTVKKIQQALNDQDYYDGTIDGYDNAATRLAIKAYQADHNLPIDGRANSRLLDHLTAP